MSLIENYFGKTSGELTFNDIEFFFLSEREESDRIEFKAFFGTESIAEKNNGVVRSIAGFLNSTGGVLIWGAPVGKAVDGKKEKQFQGELSPVNVLIEKDAFINKLSDTITPTPNAISFTRLEKGGNYLYIIEVSESEHSPHQFKNIYYMRLDGQTRPAPHHYIEALFKKIRFPKLKGFIKLEKVTHDGQNIHLILTPFILNLSKLQNEYDLYFRMVVTVGVFTEAVYSTHNSPYAMGGHEKRVLKARDVLYYNEPYTHSERIEFNFDAISEVNGIFQILIYFGGKQSPLLISKYKLKIDFHRISPENLNDMFIEINENIYAHDHSDTLGFTEQERIAAYLGR